MLDAGHCFPASVPILSTAHHNSWTVSGGVNGCLFRRYDLAGLAGEHWPSGLGKLVVFPKNLTFSRAEREYLTNDQAGMKRGFGQWYHCRPFVYRGGYESHHCPEPTIIFSTSNAAA